VNDYKKARDVLTAGQFAGFLMGYFGALARDAEPIMREFARKNPKHQYDGREQDPYGVHNWLERFDAIKKEDSDGKTTD